MAVAVVVAVIVLVLIDFYQQNRVAIRLSLLLSRIYFLPSIKEHCAMNDDVNRVLVINADRC